MPSWRSLSKIAGSGSVSQKCGSGSVLKMSRIRNTADQWCGCGSGIRCLFDPWIRDSGWVKSQDPDPGWTTPIRELRNHFLVKILKFFELRMQDPGSGMEKFGSEIQDQDREKFGSGIRGGKDSDPGSGINISDPQHCCRHSTVCQWHLVD